MYNRIARHVSMACACLTCAVSPLGAQVSTAPHGALRGVVHDAETGQPLAAAQVRLVPLLHHEELTRADGTFFLSDIEPGTHTLVVERLGYRSVSQSIEVEAGATAIVEIELTVSAIELGGLVVETGALSARARDDVLSPVTTMSGADLDRRTDQTIAAMLDGRPGLTSTSLGPTTARPIIRGLGGNRILMLEDGLKPGDMSSTSSDHAVAVEPLTARQVEVVRGPMSLMYGSSALGGVVNLVREEVPGTLPDRPHGSLMLQGMSANDGLTAGGFASTSLGRWAVRAEGTARTFGDLATPVGDLSHTGGDTYSAALGASIPGEHAHGGGAYRFYANDYGIPGGFVGGHPTGVDISMRRHTMRGEFEVHRDQGIVSSVDVNGGYTHYHHEEFEPSGNLGTSFVQNLMQGQVVVHHAETGILAEGALGIHAQYRDIQTGGTLKTPSTWDYSLAGFLIEELGPEHLRFQFGLRYDVAQYTPRDTASFVTAGGERTPVRQRTFGAVSGSGGLLWKASDALRFGASVSRAYRTPDFNELFSNGPHLAANSYDVGDPSLGRETGFGMDVFARLTNTRVHAEVAAYRNLLDGYIFPSSRGRAELGAQGGRPRFQYTNEDARFIGVEGEVVAALTRAIRLEASGSLVQAEFSSERSPIPVFDGTDTTFVAASEHPPLIPPPQGRLGVRFERPGYFAGVGAKLVARQDRLGDFETPTAGYSLLDLTAGLRLVRGGTLHTITLRVDNALDREYRDHLSRVKDIMPGAGRSVSLLYRMAF